MRETTISILPEYLANQIAAGEVVQRPASVVKELIENALDASATAITVVVRDAGRRLIHVIDNGKGMHRSDVELSVVRHATSKITSERDLHAIRTLGFRGEALASIAAVADVEIRSRRASDDMGTVLTARPGQPAAVTSAALDQGTQVLVRQLFATVPARRKFLKSDLTETRHVSEVMQRAALARPDVRWTYYDGDDLVFDLAPAELRTRAAAVLAVQRVEDLLEVDASEHGITVEGFVGQPSIARQSRSGQFLFLNGRPISSRALNHAIASAYEHILSTAQHPVFILHVTIDPERVDVNVHPQKHEVKFEDERAVYLLLQHAVSDALQRSAVVPRLYTDMSLAERPLQSLLPSNAGSPGVATSYVNRVTGEIHTSVPAARAMSSAYPPSGPRTPIPREQIEHLFGRQDAVVDAPRSILHVGRQYLITSSAEGLVVIDQHAAHERILFERVLGAMSEREASTAATQSLMFAVTMTLSAAHMAVWREYRTEFEHLGFRIESENATSIRIEGVPRDVMPGTEQDVVQTMIQALEHHGQLPPERRQEGVVAAFAARQAVRRGEELTSAEQQNLVQDLFRCTVPHVTSRGEPTYVLIPFDDLVQRFR